jgi:hypothetical protein
MGIIRNLIGFVKKVDMFGQEIKLRINKQTVSKTFVGGILSNLMFILLFLMFFFQAQDVFYKTNPFISLEQQVLKHAPELVLDYYSFPMAASLTGMTNLGIYLPNFFKYSAILFWGNTDADEFNQQHFDLIPCKKDFFPNIEKEVFYDLALDRALCVENQNFTLSGSYSDKYMAFLTYKISICVNSTESSNCAPTEEIMSYLSSTSFFWNVYYQDTNINCQDANYPVSYNIVNFYQTISTTSYKFSELYIRKQNLESDEGLIFKDSKESSSIAFDYYRFDSSNLDDSKTLVEIYILVSNNKLIYHRSYMKIQSVLANVGGLANILKIVFLIMSYIFSVVKRDEIILNKIFDYDYSEDSGNKVIKTESIVINDEKFKERCLNINRHFTKVDDKIISKAALSHREIKIPAQMNENQENISKNFEQKIFERPSYDIKYNTIKILKKENMKLPLKLNSIRNSESAESYQDSKANLNNEKNNQIIIENSYEDKKDIKTNLSFFARPKSKLKKTFRKTDAKELINILKSKNKGNQLKFSFWEIFIAFLCCSSCMNSKLKSKKRLYTKSHFALEDFMDITFIIQKLEEYEKFKIVMLNTQQLALFNFISKELMSLDENKLEKHVMTHFKNLDKDKENLANIIIEFREKLANSKLDERDKKLYDLLTEEFKV